MLIYVDMGLEIPIIHAIERSHNVFNRNFPSRQDYERYYLEKGYAESVDAIWSNQQHVLNIQRHWHMQGQNGCIFAQAIAHNPEKVGWKREVLMPDEMLIDDDFVGDRIDLLIQRSIAEPGNELLSLLIPSIETPGQLAKFIRILGNTKSINIADVIDHNGISSLALRTPLNDGQVQSWLVAFAPMDYLPETRKAPVFELAIRTKLKPDHMFHLLNKTPDEAHLADVPTGFSDKVMEKLWQATYIRTREMLGGDEQRKANPFASAKVTIALPTEIWKSTLIQ